MARFLRSTARGEFSDEGLAQFWSTAAAVLHQKARDLAHAIDNRPIDDGPTLALGLDEASTRQDGQVCGHRVLRHLKASRDFASGQTFRFVLHEQSERIETRGL